MDPFEVRMQFLSLLRRLNASQQSIQKVVAYSLKYFSRCGDLIWDCIVEECQKGSLNTRINILYLLDALCEASLLSKASFSSSSSSGSGGGNRNLYIDFIARDLANVVGYVVPPGREGLINLMSTVQILENWKNKRTIDAQEIDEILKKLESQKSSISHEPDLPNTSQDALQTSRAQFGITGEADTGSGAESLAFSRNEIFKRIEEDRERHKRLRERRWVQPVVYEKNIPVLASFAPLPPERELPSTALDPECSLIDRPDDSAKMDTESSTAPPDVRSVPELPLDIEFDNEWETTSDWNEDDEEAVTEENALCYPNAAVRYGDNPSAPPPHFTSSVLPTVTTSFGSSSRIEPKFAPSSDPSDMPPRPAGQDSVQQRSPIKIDRTRAFDGRW